MKKYFLSIKNNIILLYIVITVITFGIIYYILFSNWINTANDTLYKIADEMNKSVYAEFNQFVDLPKFINEVTQNQIQNGIIDINDENKREMFFVGLLKVYDSSPIYSISYGTESGEYYGARKNKNNAIEIMKNNTETGRKTRYFSVTDKLRAGNLVMETGIFDPRTRAWYKAAKESGKTIFAPLYKHFVMNDLTLSVATPVYSREGRLSGVLGTHITLSKIDRFLRDIVRDKHAVAIIVEKSTGELVANSLNVSNFNKLSDGTIKRKIINDLNVNNLRIAYNRYLANKDICFVLKNKNTYDNVIISEFNNNGLEFILVTLVSDILLLSNINTTINNTIILTLLMLLFLTIFYLISISKLLKPLESLNSTAKKFSEGDFSQRETIVRNNEIGKLSITFNKMAETIQQLVENLEHKVKDRTSELERINNILTENKRQLQLILDSAAEGIYGIDTNGNCTFSNTSALNMLGYKNQYEVLCKNMHSLIHHSTTDGLPAPMEKCKILRALLNGKGTYVDDEVFWRKDGTRIEVRYSSYPQFVNGAVVGAVVTFLDNTTRRKNEERIQYLTHHDSLTGLYNRMFFENKLHKIDNSENLPISIIFGDLNGLKLTNDIFGHVAGDELLKKTSNVLKKTCREGDIIARLGGDEFAVILPKTEYRIANTIMADIKRELYQEHVAAIKASISLGVDTKNNEEEPDIQQTLVNAENLMYKDKTINRKSTNINLINTIIENLHNRSNREKSHSFNVSEICQKIGKEMRLSVSDVRKLRDIGYYHDIGKIVLDDNIINKHDRFTVEEKSLMNQHSVIGYRILNMFDETLDLAEGVFSHHEHWDGTGYPKGIKGAEIPLLSRIVAVAEVYDAMTNSFYGNAKSKEEAIAVIKEQSGIRFDPVVVEAFLNII